MKKVTITLLLSTILLVSITCGQAFCINETPEEHGAAPNSHDGYPDGSGFDRDDWPNGDSGMGPAPNSGDGVPDGSGF